MSYMIKVLDYSFPCKIVSYSRGMSDPPTITIKYNVGQNDYMTVINADTGEEIKHRHTRPPFGVFQERFYFDINQLGETNE